MHGGDVNKLEMRVQILDKFQGADLVLLTETSHFPCQHLPHVEGSDSLAVARIVKLGRTKVIKHSGGVLLIFAATSSQIRHSGRKEAMILIYGYGLVEVMPLIYLYVAPIGFKHKNESFFQNLVGDIVEVQIVGGIVLLGEDFNAHIVALPDTTDINDLCELLHVRELVETKQPGVVAKQ
jgi:hypothetical protein